MPPVQLKRLNRPDCRNTELWTCHLRIFQSMMWTCSNPTTNLRPRSRLSNQQTVCQAWTTTSRLGLTLLFPVELLHSIQPTQQPIPLWSLLIRAISPFLQSSRPLKTSSRRHVPNQTIHPFLPVEPLHGLRISAKWPRQLYILANRWVLLLEKRKGRILSRRNRWLFLFPQRRRQRHLESLVRSRRRLRRNLRLSTAITCPTCATRIRISIVDRCWSLNTHVFSNALVCVLNGLKVDIRNQSSVLMVSLLELSPSSS